MIIFGTTGKPLRTSLNLKNSLPLGWFTIFTAQLELLRCHPVQFARAMRQPSAGVSGSALDFVQEDQKWG